MALPDILCDDIFAEDPPCRRRAAPDRLSA